MFMAHHANCYRHIHDCVIIILSFSLFLRNFVYQLRRISNDAGMPVSKEPFFQRYVSGVDNVEPLFRQLKHDRADLQLIVVVLPGKTPVYGQL